VQYKQQKEAEFKKFEAEHTGANAQVEQEADKEVEQKLQEIKRLGEEKMGKVIGDLLKAVGDAKPKPHRNAAKVA